VALPKKKIKKDRPSNPIKKKEKPKYVSKEDAFKNPLSKKRVVSDVPGKSTSRARGNLRLDGDMGIYGRKRSLNKRDMV
jgi:hypothetical protein